jgi:UDP-3-O-[3-hydroxymyristoyl] glucosamine N-acyltransferase
MAGIAGSCVIGSRVLVGASAGIADHVTIGDDATIGAGSGLAANVAAGTVFSGNPAGPHMRTLERLKNVGRLRMLYPKIEDMKKRLEALEKSGKDD